MNKGLGICYSEVFRSRINKPECVRRNWCMWIKSIIASSGTRTIYVLKWSQSRQDVACPALSQWTGGTYPRVLHLSTGWMGSKMSGPFISRRKDCGTDNTRGYIGPKAIFQVLSKTDTPSLLPRTDRSVQCIYRTSYSENNADDLFENTRDRLKCWTIYGLLVKKPCSAYGLGSATPTQNPVPQTPSLSSLTQWSSSEHTYDTYLRVFMSAHGRTSVGFASKRSPVCDCRLVTAPGSIPSSRMPLLCFCSQQLHALCNGSGFPNPTITYEALMS
jgi:hypothetical protein